MAYKTALCFMALLALPLVTRAEPHYSPLGLVQAARAQIGVTVTYAYRTLRYPNGDVPIAGVLLRVFGKPWQSLRNAQQIKSVVQAKVQQPPPSLPLPGGGAFSLDFRLYDGEGISSLPCEGEGWGGA